MRGDLWPVLLLCAVTDSRKRQMSLVAGKVADHRPTCTRTNDGRRRSGCGESKRSLARDCGRLRLADSSRVRWTDDLGHAGRKLDKLIAPSMRVCKMLKSVALLYWHDHQVLNLAFSHP